MVAPRSPRRFYNFPPISMCVILLLAVIIDNIHPLFYRGYGAVVCDEPADIDPAIKA